PSISELLEPSASALSRRASDLPLHGRKGGLVRDSIADSESFRSASQGGRLQSEWVADFRRNRWPDCVGISGRLPSDCATETQDEANAAVERFNEILKTAKGGPFKAR